MILKAKKKKKRTKTITLKNDSVNLLFSFWKQPLKVVLLI